MLVESILSCLAALRVFIRSRGDTALEILALRQQLTVLKRNHPRPKIGAAGLDLLDCPPPLLVPLDRGPHHGQARNRRQLARDQNPWRTAEAWLGRFRTVAHYLRRIRRRRDPGKQWLAFLQNHREAIVAFDFFTVPTVNFQFALLLLRYRATRRKILHLNVTRHPSADWVVQQLRDAFPEAGSYRYVILDRDAKFDDSVTTSLQATGLTAKRTSVQAPIRILFCQAPDQNANLFGDLRPAPAGPGAPTPVEAEPGAMPAVNCRNDQRTLCAIPLPRRSQRRRCHSVADTSLSLTGI